MKKRKKVGRGSEILIHLTLKERLAFVLNTEAYRCQNCKIALFSYAEKKKDEPKKPEIKYPEDLLARYTELYPHNPEGVIEVHIMRKVKTGKTRADAIKELEAEG